MKHVIVFSTILSLFFLSGCSNDGAKAEELFETAQFEELQKNQDHARELYKEIMEKYSDTKFAGKAKIKLTAMGNQSLNILGNSFSGQ
jgi:TolA-binding protein